MEKPTRVKITLNSRFAIHPYFIVLGVSDQRQGFGVSTHVGHTGTRSPQVIKGTTMEDTLDVAVIELENPILLLGPIPGACHAEKYESLSAPSGSQKINSKEKKPVINPYEQDMNIVHMYAPTRCDITLDESTFTVGSDYH
ncbi:uncharacterized protein LOC117173267 isoform X2 [Belonocnema kinseyi]|uniref:uncharacterized protein LOC117173267 isoform X2 n=1 Tax=Belonocnema kinseyi TaxID=2817044 RepID=UPI00143D39F8|nr:uncharacterized protein LOC117173267 isoform X2 [Belonocnema kinseyi]